jgi:hypothetical protein
LATPGASSPLDAPDVPPPGVVPAEFVGPEPLVVIAAVGEVELPPTVVVWLVPVVDVVLDGTSPAVEFGDVEALEVVVTDELGVVDVNAVVLTGANGVGIGVAAVVVTIADGVGIGVAAVVVTIADGVGIGVATVVVTI